LTIALLSLGAGISSSPAEESSGSMSLRAAVHVLVGECAGAVLLGAPTRHLGLSLAMKIEDGWCRRLPGAEG
jgi:hypothetical protein